MLSVFEMSEYLKWKETGKFRRWYTKIQSFLIGQGALDIANDIDSKLDAWIGLTTPPTSEDQRQQKRAQITPHDWKVRQQKAFYTIQIDIGQETRRCDDYIKMLSALIKIISENDTKMLKKDTEAIVNRLFILKLENCSTVWLYYNVMQMLYKDLWLHRQPKTTD